MIPFEVLFYKLATFQNNVKLKQLSYHQIHLIGSYLFMYLFIYNICVSHYS